MSNGTDEWLHAAFASTAEAEDALAQVASDGVGAECIEIRSSAPVHFDSLPSGIYPVSRVPGMPVIGGLLGGTSLFFLVKFTSEVQGLPTGGMPIFPLMPAGVIIFEGVAVGAILFTVATLLYECGLPRPYVPGPLDAYLADDHVLVSIRCSGDASTVWASRAIETRRG